MEFYNKYLKYVNNFDYYESEIAFINTNMPILEKNAFFINFPNSKKSGFYESNDYLRSIYIKSNYGNKTESLTNGYASSITPAKHYYSFIKVIKDAQFPQLEDQILIFKYGYKIHSLIYDYFENELPYDRLRRQKHWGWSEDLFFKHSFRLKIKKVLSIYRSYDDSFFTTKSFFIQDNTLNLNDFIKELQTITNFLSMERKDKFEQIENNLK